MAESFVICELGKKSYTKKLGPRAKRFDLVWALVPFDALAKFVSGKEIHKWGENGLAGVQEPSPSSRSKLMKYSIFGG